MTLVSRLVAGAGTLCLLTVPAVAAPVAGSVTFVPPSVERALPFMNAGCNENDYEPPEDDGGSEGEGEGSATNYDYGIGTDNVPTLVDCEGSGSSYEDSGPGYTDIMVSSIESGIEHCGQYTEVWRIDCISDELERMARKMPKTSDYRRAKSEILAASAKLQALAEQNANPHQPPVRRAATVDGVRRTTTRPITAVAPSRVVATNLAADAVIGELSTTLLRSAGNSASTSLELTRVAQAVDSTKVLLRST